MFDSRGIISKKGLLGSVWMAAHCLQKLKKKDVMETDIITCVDTILHGEANELTYRILAYLLLGVVRIYSKKVEFLQRDFADILREVKNFKAAKEIRRIKFHNSITIPKSFELDTFNLDIPEDQDVSRVHVGSREDITLADDSKGDIFCKNDKYHRQECTFSYENFSLANTPVRDVCSPWFMDIDSEIRLSYHKCISKSRIENLVGTRISLGKCLDQEILGEKNPGFHMSSDVRCQTDGKQIMHHDGRMLWEKSTNNKSVETITLDDTGNDTALDMVLDGGETDGEQMNCPYAETNYQGPATMEELVGDIENNPGFEMSSDVRCQTDGQQIMHHDAGILLEKSTNYNSVQPSTLDDAGKDSALDMVLGEGETDGEQMNCPDAETNYQGPATMEESVGDIEKNPGFDMPPSDVRCQTDGEQIMHHEVGILMEKSANNNSVQPITLDDAGKDSVLDLVLDEGETDVEQMNCPDAETNYRGPAMAEKSVGNEQSVEKLCQFGFTAADHLKLFITDEVENDAHSAMSSREEHQMLGGYLKHHDMSINFELEEKRLPPKTSLRNQIQRKSSSSLADSVTPSTKITGGSGSAEFMAIHTPPSKPHARVLRKQKCLLDEKVVISNKVLQDQISDSSNLVRKRGCAPLTALHAWRVQKRCNLSKAPFESLIPCKGIDFIALVSEKKSKTRLSVKTAEIPVNPVMSESPVTQMYQASAEASENPVVGESTTEQTAVKVSTAPLDPVHVGSPVIQIPLETAEAPDTPILVESSATHMSLLQTPTTPTPFTQSTTLRLHDNLEVPEPDILESVRSFYNVEKQKTLSEDQESPDIRCMDKDPTSPVRGNVKKCEWSAETWKAASYLHQNISNLKQHKQDDNGFLNLSQGLEKESRTVCAKLFYEILTLKTGDYINVKQEDAYGDILVQEKPKLKQTLDAHNRTFPQA